MKTETRDREEAPVRMTRGFRRLQSVVNRYLDDSGGWIEDVSQVLKEMARITADLERRERSIAYRESKLDEREVQLESLFESIVTEAKRK